MNPTFWMVYKIGGKSPRKRHDTREEAHAEAERLGELMPYDVFCIVEKVDAVGPKLDGPRPQIVQVEPGKAAQLAPASAAPRVRGPLATATKDSATH